MAAKALLPAIPMPTTEAQVLLGRLSVLERDATAYFDALPEVERTRMFAPPRDIYWDQIPAEAQRYAGDLALQLVDFGHDAGAAARRSPLLTVADVTAIGFGVKAMRAALRLRDYHHWDTDVVHDEGTVLGVTRAGESDDRPTAPRAARQRYVSELAAIRSVLELVGPPSSGEVPRPGDPVDAAAIRPGTAFIMMSMQADQPELTDVADTVKRCFERFGIQAVRADDIEHEDVITARILDEIRTAEFLFADLSGERPSVYYEVGYAHALRRRVILVRRAGTTIHFDLAAYNCPEYENLRALEELLTRRLEHNTGQRAPGEPAGADQPD